MNTRPIIDDSRGPTSLCVSFNHDASCFCVGHENGFCVFSSNPCELRVSRDFNAGIGVTGMLGRYNFLALAGGGKRPKYGRDQVVVWDDAKQKAVISLDFSGENDEKEKNWDQLRRSGAGAGSIQSLLGPKSEAMAAVNHVLGVRLSKSRLIVILRYCVKLYTFASPTSKISDFDTAENPAGLCCLGDKIIAFPGRSAGQIQLVELEARNVTIIPAHSTPLRAMSLSADGQLLATASEQGTLIRVFNTGNCARIAELRRGVDPALIFSIAISPSSTMLAVTSDKSTLHVFDLPTSSPSSSASRLASTPSNRRLPPTPRNTSPSSATSNLTATQTDGISPPTNPANKWGLLSKLPLLPRVFSDIYSFASAQFDMGDSYSKQQYYQHHQRQHYHKGQSNSFYSASAAPLEAGGNYGSPPQTGQVGWTDDDTIVVVNAGIEGKWERFRLMKSEGDAGVDTGKICLKRDAWKRYLG